MFLPFEEKLLEYALNSGFAPYIGKLSHTLYLLIFLYMGVVWKTKRSGWVRAHYAFAFITTTLLVFLIKHATNILRPFEAVGLAVTASQHIGSSFPSAHATIAFFCAAVVAAQLKRKNLAYVLYLWAAVISISRFFAGLHYIVDLVGGAVLGYLLGVISFRFEAEAVDFYRYLVFNTEGKRKIVHTLIGFSFALLVYFGPYREVVLSFFGLSVVSLICSVMFKVGKTPSLISGVIHKLEREDEKREFPAQGAFSFFLSSTIVVFFFPTKIAAAAITALALGDGFATLIGKKYGRRKLQHNRHKSMEGSVAGFFACLFGSMLFVNIWLSVLNSAVFMIAESAHLEIKKRKVNDNLYIPVLCALALYLAQSL